MLSRDSSRRELDVLKKISRKTVLPEGIVELLDDFVVISSQMVQYHCLVLEAMWQNAWYFCKGFQLEYRPLLTRHISCQLLQGLNSLKRMGIIHNGRAWHMSWQLTLDLHPLNFLIAFKPIKQPWINLSRNQSQRKIPRNITGIELWIPGRNDFMDLSPFVWLTEPHSIWKTSVLKSATLDMVISILDLG